MYYLENGSEERRFSSLERLEPELDRLHTEISLPTVVTVRRDSSRDAMSIGLGAAFSVVNYLPSDVYSSACKMSVDREQRFARDRRIVSFCFGGEQSEYSSRNAIPVEVARAVLREFCLDGVLSDEIEWEEV